MKNNRFLNIAYAVEVLNGRINGSASQVENNKTGYDNITFTKKVNGKAYVSSACIKKSMKNFMEENDNLISSKNKIKGKIITDADPFKNIDEDIFGFMLTSSGMITDEVYKELEPEEQANYKQDKSSKDWKLSIKITKKEYDLLSNNEKKAWKGDKKEVYSPVPMSTKKRRANFMMNGLIGVGSGKVNREWGVCETNTYNMPYVLETYSDIMVGIGNLNINHVGEFEIGNKDLDFKDYDVIEGIEKKSLYLSKEEKFKRIETALKSFQYLSIKSNQSNYLVDTMPKVVILAEYKYGNNVFQGLINKDGINIEGLKETIDEFDIFRISKIWIGVSAKIMNENFKGLKEKLQDELKEFDFIEIGTIKSSFDGYIRYLKESM